MRKAVNCCFRLDLHSPPRSDRLSSASTEVKRKTGDGSMFVAAGPRSREELRKMHAHFNQNPRDSGANRPTDYLDGIERNPSAED
jgi:hypothetical protein